LAIEGFATWRPMRGVRRKERILARTSRGGQCKALGLECTTTSQKGRSASQLLDAMVKWSSISGNVL